MKIVKFHAENFQKLKAVEITPDGNIVKITGKCEQGKTTILDAIHAALGGGTMPEKPIREGEKKASIVIDLGEMTVTRSFTPSGTTLKIENKEGFKASKPQDLLDKIVGKLAFDPLEFARADQKKQVEMLLSVVDLKIDMAKLQQISGVNIETDGSPLDILNKYYAEVMENRKLTNRQLDSAKKVLADIPEVTEVQPVSVAELVTEKERLQQINESNFAVRNLCRAAGEKVDAEYQKVVDIENGIKELEQKLITLRQSLVEQNKAYDNAKKILTDFNNQVALLQDEDLTEINEKIKNADETNKKAQQYTNRQTKQAEVEKYQTESDDYTAKLKAIIDYKNEIVSKAKFPVEGLDFAGGGVVYQKIPFKQASTAQALKVSTAIGMALNPKLRVMLIDGAESLDSTQMGYIAEMAKDQDYQLWLTAVSEDEKVGIYIEDGEIKKVAE